MTIKYAFLSGDELFYWVIIGKSRRCSWCSKVITNVIVPAAPDDTVTVKLYCAVGVLPVKKGIKVALIFVRVPSVR
jgi:hypothetical protein